MAASGSIVQSIEIPKWLDLKAIIDANPKFGYDHALKSDVSDLTVRVRQSNEFTYYTIIKYGTADYDDYINNYADGASRGVDSAISVTTTFSDSFNLDAFSRLRTGNPHSLFDSTQIFNDQPLFWNNVLTGGGTATYRSNEASTRLECTTANGDKVIRQTKEYFNYQPGKCRLASDYIPLADGRRIQAKDLVDTEFKLLTVRDGKRIEVDAIAEWNAYEPIYKIKTKSGNELCGNAQHPLWVGKKYYKTFWKKGNKPHFNIKEWTNLENIKIGDFVAIADTLPIFGTNNNLTESDAKILAYLIGDGGISAHHVTFSQNKGSQLDEFESLVGQYDCVLKKKKGDSNSYHVVYKNGSRKGKNGITKLLRKVELLGKSSAYKFIPNDIFESPKEIITTFLSRLYSTDGWAFKDEIGYCSISEQLVKDIKELLLKFGIHGNIHSKIPKCNGKECSRAYILSLHSKKDIELFYKEIGIYGKEEDVEKVYNKIKNRKESTKFKYLFKNIQDSLRWDIVESIEIIGYQWTVAIGVPDGNTYLTSFYEHNSLRIAMTGIMGSEKAGVVKRIGYFDDYNGVFFEQTSTGGLYVVERSYTTGSVVENKVQQDDWNIDTLDGTGKSAITVDVSKGQIFILDIQWLGMGRVRMGFSIDGEFYYIHQFLHANIIDKVYMQTANLPLRYEIENTSSTASNTYMDNVCVEIESEGGYNPKGVTRSVTTGAADRVVGATYVPIIALRLKETYKRAQILPLTFKTYNESNTLVHVKLIHGATLTGASWVSAGTNSIAEYDITASAYSGGEEIEDMFVSSQGADRNQLASEVPEMLLKLVSNYSGDRDILVLVGKSLGTSSTMHASLSFREVY